MSKTRHLSLIAILSTISFLLMYLQFPLIPSANFLQVDFSIVPILFGLILLDVRSSFAILLVRTLLKVLFNTQGLTTVIGLPMNMAMIGIFILSAAYWVKKDPTLVNFIKMSFVATLGSTLAMVLLNYLYAIPVYAVVAQFDIGQVLGVKNYLLFMVMPFNLLQGMLLSFVYYVSYRAAMPLLRNY